MSNSHARLPSSSMAPPSPGLSAASASAAAAGGMLSSAASFLMSSVPSALSTVSRYSMSGSSTPSRPSAPHFDRDLDRLFHARIRPLLDAVDALRGLLRDESAIQLPTIVVVGDQSSGKSSVLEALSGVALPRGSEITTRCPLVLRLINTAVDSQGNALPKPKQQQVAAKANGADHGSDGVVVGGNSASGADSSAYAVISIKSPNVNDGEMITDLSQIGHKVEELTRQLAGRGIGVVSAPIYLSVFRAHSPDLTLVDLPGITRNPVGDQPKDIYRQIKEMIYQFIRPETAVILNVMPATVDFPTCECVMMAKDVDANNDRTIGVVTKLDLAEKGIRRKLERGVEQLDLRLGVVAVRNRTQEENERGISFELARQMEATFFSKHSELSSLAVDFAERQAAHHAEHGESGRGGLFLGTSNLAQLLTIIQEQRIRTTLPGIRIKCRDMLQEFRAKYRELPTGNVTTGGEARVKIEHLLNTCMSQIAALVRGEHSSAKGDLSLHISPRLAELYKSFKHELAASSSNFFSADYAKVVAEEMRENAGTTLPNFQSSQVFKGLMYKELRKVSVPASALLEQSRSLVAHVVQSISKSVFNGYPALLHRVQTIINAFLDTRVEILMDRLEEMIMQEEEVFTMDPYYMDAVQKLKGTISERLAAAEQTFIAGSKSGAAPALPASFEVRVNDLTVAVRLGELIRHAEKAAREEGTHNTTIHSPASANGSPLHGFQALRSGPGAAILDLQVSAFVYTHVFQRRICDALPLLIRFHLLRTLTQSAATQTALAALGRQNAAAALANGSSSSPAGGLSCPSHMSLSSRLQKEFIDMPDRTLLECMKEEASIARQRETLTKKIEKMEQAVAVFDAI